MKPEHKVCSFEQSVELALLGIDQELQPGDSYWVTLSSGENRCFYLSENEDLPPVMYQPKRAFDATELGFLLIRGVATRLPQWNEKKRAFSIVLFPNSEMEKTICSTSESVARAEQLLWLLDQRILVAEEVNQSIRALRSLQTLSYT
ncbi:MULTISPECIES: hypothetical protein [unclassified Spirosoma]|mgnify:CR=1 FL=1|uniref:hypothetical protein n=1 Tax=unclassified Spirosoma TaxID=2621999 RepID=UPI0009610E6D|nr:MULTISPECIES: hypothetical protein [unclassified Spirosoma]MBN8821298.1 hypothetical protein [Spirosoma sp.]OJW78087.1 MAG: hypothetical protein BGO59_29145 [Spirosoma sp. 48-14]